MENNIKLKGIKIIKGILRCETGLHIGGEKANIEIGGIDNTIIRNPVDDFPYIPGSSIKGKIRTLLEYKNGKVSEDGKPHSCDDSNCPICLIFGPGKTENEKIGPTRAIFRDAFLTEESKKKLMELRQKKGLIYVEEKTENTIDRIKGTAKNPRTIERVPQGTEFNFEIIYRVFEANNDEGNFNYLLEGLKLLQKDALGGSGSRGYGKVSIFINCKDGKYKNIEEIKAEDFPNEYEQDNNKI